MDPKKFHIGSDGKPIPPYPRLLFICTRVLPAVFAAGALQIAVLNYFYPMTEEERRKIEERRRGPSKSGQSIRNRSGERPNSPELSENIVMDDTDLITDNSTGGLDLTHLQLELNASDQLNEGQNDNSIEERDGAPRFTTR